MPHIIQEQHLEDICAQCKKPHGNNITLEHCGHKVYEIIECQNCGYEIIRLRKHVDLNEKWQFNRRTLLGH